MKINNMLAFCLIFLLGCSNTVTTFANEDDRKPDHKQWTDLLSKHVRNDGMVDYKGFVKDIDKLNAYANHLSETPPAENWTDEEKIAYWINAYNVYTVKLIADNYPVESIKDLNPVLSIPTVRSIWTKEWFKIGGEDFSLDQIEHKILRKDFEEPRIHFAVNCASISCPISRNEAYTAGKLDRQLDEQATIFLNDESRNKIKSDEVRISKIFSWFGGDFKKDQTLIDFINRYSKVKVDQDAKVRFMDYDWGLNETQKGN